MKKTEKKRPVLYYILLGVFGAVFLFSAVYIGYYLVQANQAKQLNSQLQDMKDKVVQLSTEEQPTASEEETTATEETLPVILPEYRALYERNNDLVGWIHIPDTNIDYPVVQSPYEANFYLHRNFDKEYSYGGTLYARETCDVFAPSDNITIYGHRMEKPDGSMFYQLDKFKKQEFWKDHQTFTFDTLYEHHTYQIVCVFKTHGTEGYPYHRFENGTKEQFDEFVSTVKSMEFYETGVTAEYGDKLICLSTCEYSLGDGRFVVVAKRIS